MRISANYSGYINQNTSIYKETVSKNSEVDGKSVLKRAAGTDDLDFVDFVIQLGADVNLCDSYYNKSALHEAAKSGKEKMCRLLLQKGANPNIIGRWSNFSVTGTPLHVALGKGNPSLIKLLIKFNARVDLRNEWGETPLHVAAYYGIYGETINLLIDAGAKVNVLNNRDISWTAKGSPLHVALERGHSATLSSLIKHGANVNRANSDGNTPIMTLLKKEHFHSSHLNSLDTILAFKPNLNHKNHQGETVYDIISKRRDEEQEMDQIGRQYFNELCSKLI